MKDKNFNSISNIEVPDSFIEKALSVPAVLPAKKKSAYVFSVTRIVSFAACFMLLVVLSGTVYFMTKKGVQPPVLSTKTVETQTNGQTESSDLSVAEQTEKKNVNEAESINPTKHGEVQKIEETEKAVAPTDTLEPSVNNSSKPTDSPTEPVTEQKPTQKPTSAVVTGATLSAVFNCGDVGGDDYTFETVLMCYCRIYDENGNLLGDQDLYSYQHIVTDVYTLDGYAYASYYPSDMGLVLTQGNYRYVFYDDKGIVLYEGLVTL